MQILQSTKWEKWRADTIETKEPETICWIKDFAPGSIFYDIGANIGIYTLYAAELNRNIRIFSFEPHVFNFQHLKDNINANQFQEVAYPVFAALADTDGIAQFDMKNLAAGSSGGQIMQMPNDKELPPGIYNIPIRSIDSYAYETEDRFPNYIKIDVDGQEDKIVDGMAKVLCDPRLKSVLIEINGPTDPIRRRFIAAGFTDANEYTELSRKIMEQYAEKGYRKAYNAIFTRKSSLWARFIRYFTGK